MVQLQRVCGSHARSCDKKEEKRKEWQINKCVHFHRCTALANLKELIHFYVVKSLLVYSACTTAGATSCQTSPCLCAEFADLNLSH